MVLARLLQVNPDIQVLALSATINNVDEIAGWLNAKYIVTEWRPVSLKEGVLLNDEIQYKDGDARKVEQKTHVPHRKSCLKHIEDWWASLGFCFNT